MRRTILILGGLVGLFLVTTGCSQIEKQADYGTMTGAIPADSWLSGFGSGRNVGP